MRFGAHTLIWVAPFTNETLHLVERVRQLGFEAIDIGVGEVPPPFDVGALRQQLTANGLQATLATSLNAQRDITSEVTEIRRTGVEFLCGIVQLCGEVGAVGMIGPIHSELRRQRLDPPTVREERWKRCVEGLAAVAREADRADVTVAVEVLNRFENDFLTTTADGVRLCREIGSPRLGLLLDTFHMNIEERNLGEAIRSARGHITHFHTCENDRGAPGTGHINWPEVRDALQDVGYDGTCTIESYNPDVATLAQRISIWRRLAPTQDQLAADGLTFIRKLFAP